MQQLFALYGGEMVTHTGNPFYGEALRTRVRFPPPPQPALGSLGTRMGAGDLTV